MRTWLMVPVRSLDPLLAVVIVAGTVLWGPWVSLGLAISVHLLVGRTQ